MATKHGFTAGRFAVELEGVHVGFAIAVSGGEPFADVIEEPPVDVTFDKHLGPRRYEPIVIEFGASMTAAWYDVVDEMLQGKGRALDGAVVMLDHNNLVRQRLEWKAGLITEVGFPKADGADKSTGRIRVVIAPQAVTLTSGSGAFRGGATSGKAQKAWLSSNFQFAVSGLESASTNVSKVSAITVHRGEDGVLTVDDIECTVPTIDAAPFRAWFDGLVDGKDGERTAVLMFLDPSMKNELMRVELRALGAFRVADERQEAGAEVIARARVQMYCEGVRWERSKSTESTPETREAGTRSRLDGDRSAALPDALGSSARTPLSKETIAARLLSDSTAVPDETGRERGLTAGRVWAGDEARLDELEDLAAVAERDEWSALALDDGHTLRTFLTSRGEIPADEAPLGDLGRDEFTTGLLAGIAEIHREVAPLINGRGHGRDGA